MGGYDEQPYVDRLMEYLTARGEVVTLTGRPDTTIRDRRAVDFEVEVGGQIVALEVVRLDQAIRSWKVSRRLVAGIKTAVEPMLAAEALGAFDLEMTMVCAPTDRDINALIAAVVTELLPVARRLRHGEAQGRTPLDLGAWSTNVTMVMELDDPTPASGLRVWNWGSGQDPDITEQAAQFVTWLVAKKGDQADGYDEAWLLIIGGETMIEADAMDRAFSEHEGSLPANWRRLFYVSPVDDSIWELVGHTSDDPASWARVRG